jgi:predicted glutamine amidotransferase
MCGIIGKFNHEKPANREVMYQFQDQRSRGTNGFGMMCINDDGTFDIERATSEISACINLKMRESKMIIFHHRAPTSSTNKISQTHPILIESGTLAHDYYLVHNGVIHNHDELLNKHDALGLTYSTYETKDNSTQYNDSESLGVELALYIEKQQDTMEAYGMMAFILVQVDKKTKKIIKIFFGRNNSSVLNMYQREGELMLSSEGKGNLIEPNFLYSFDPLNPKMKTKKKKLVMDRWKEESKTEIVGFTADERKANGYEWEDYKHEKGVTEYNPDVPNHRVGAEMEILEAECQDIISDFFLDLSVNPGNPFMVESVDVLKQLSRLLEDGIKQAQLSFIEDDQDSILDKVMSENKAEKTHAK